MHPNTNSFDNKIRQIVLTGFLILFVIWIVVANVGNVRRYQISANGKYVIDTKTGAFKGANPSYMDLPFEKIPIPSRIKNNRFHKKP